MLGGMTRLILIGLAILIASACSSEDDDPLTAEAFCARWAEAACSSETVEVCQAPDVDSCRASQATFCSGLLPANFASAQADRCLSAVERAYRDGELNEQEMTAVLRLEGDCGNLSAGTAAEGESCDLSADCDTSQGYDCIFKGTAAAGTCELATVVDPGQRCVEPGETCSDGFYCDGTNCVAGKPAGESCTLTRECAPEAFCLDGTCSDRLATQASCDADEECASGICYDLDDDEGDICANLLVLTLNEPFCATLS